MTPLMKLYEDNRHAAPRKFEVISKSKTEAEVMLYDVIGGFFGIDAGKFARDVKGIKADTIHLRINSPGGEVTAAKAMQTALAQHPARVVAHIDGLAASAATVVMLAADEIVASEGAFVMVHNPWGMTIGDSEDHRKNAELLEKFTEALAADYQKRTGKTDAEIRAWMDAETWFTAAEAKDAGFVDAVDETVTAKNEWDLSAYANAPAQLAVAAMAKTQPGATAAQSDVEGAAPETTTPQEVHMDNPNTQGQPNAPSPETIRAEALKAERERVSQIHALAARHQMDAAFVEAAVTGGSSIDQVRAQILETLADRGNEVNTRGATSAAVTHDATEKRRDMATMALLNRIDASKYQADGQNEFRAMSAIRMAEECLTRSGVSVRGRTANDIAIMAMQQTSDFPYILENVARKRLMDAYQYATPSYRRWTRKATSPDFKTISRPRLSEAPHMLGVPEGAQITIAPMTETRETYALSTYGRGVSFTRQMLINDDLGAFNDLIGAFGIQAAALENKTVYAILQANPNMSDSVALFDNAGHGNLGSGALGNQAFDDMYGKMAIQKGIDARTILNIMPKFIIVPAAKLGAAQAALVSTTANVKGSDQNRWAGRLEVVSDGELDTNGSGTTVWYAAADPSVHPGIEYAHLEGAEGPQMLREENTQGILGVTLYCWLDFAAKAIDWRPLYKSSGS